MPIAAMTNTPQNQPGMPVGEDRFRDDKEWGLGFEFELRFFTSVGFGTRSLPVDLVPRKLTHPGRRLDPDRPVRLDRI